MRQFRHLNVPEHWEHYWSKYPQGYTILEALVSWVSQVDNMVDNVNDWNKYLELFVKDFDKNLTETTKDLLDKWIEDGTLEVIISELLQTQINEVEDYLYDMAVPAHSFGVRNDYYLPDGTKNPNPTNNTPLLKAAIDSLPEGSTLIFPRGGHCLITDTFVVGKNVHIDNNHSTLMYEGDAGVAVQIGVPQRTVNVTSHIKVTRPFPNWEQVCVGVQTINTRQSTIYYDVSNFRTGFEVVGDTNGNGYNKFYPISLFDNKFSTIIKARNSGGWANENNFYGGRYGWSSTRDETGAVHITVQYDGYVCNSNKFWSPSLEGRSPDKNFAARIDGRHNAIYDARYEGAARIFFGSQGQHNTIMMGYDLSIENISGLVEANTIFTRDATQLTSFSSKPALTLINRNSANNPVYQIKDPTLNITSSLSARGNYIGEDFLSRTKYMLYDDQHGIFTRSGNPNGNITASSGSICIDRTGRAWFKTTDNSNTGWEHISTTVNGNYTNRPLGSVVGDTYFRTDLNKPTWWNGTNWILADGTIAPNN